MAESVRSYITALDSHERRKNQVLEKLLIFDKRVKNLQFKFCAKSFAVGALAAVAALAYPFTAGGSIVVFPVLFVFIFVVIIDYKTTEDSIVRGVDQLIAELRTIVVSVTAELESVKSPCGEFRKTRAGTKALKFITLESDILRLLAFSQQQQQTPTTLDRITSVVVVYELIFSQFTFMKYTLETLGLDTNVCVDP